MRGLVSALLVCSCVVLGFALASDLDAILDLGSDRSMSGSDTTAQNRDGHDGMSTDDHGDMRGGLVVGPTGNRVEAVPPHLSSYVPRVGAASPADRALARDLLNGANEFCRTHSPSDLVGKWPPGTTNPAKPTHLFNPGPDSLGVDPANPRAALIYKGALGGVMLTGVPLPSLGTIPRAHSHDRSTSREMVHVYCTGNLRDAFTPNRMLGVMADVRALRLQIRPRVADLGESQVERVLDRVRSYAGTELQPVPPTRSARDGGPDPILQAKREEIRRSLMFLSEWQLRSVRSLVRSARDGGAS